MEKNLFFAIPKYDDEKLISFEINQFVCQNVSYRQTTTKIFAYHFSVPSNQSVWPIKEFFFCEKVFSSDSNWRLKAKILQKKRSEVQNKMLRAFCEDIHPMSLHLKNRYQRFCCRRLFCNRKLLLTRLRRGCTDSFEE